MDRYIELLILPDPEFNAPLLWGALISKLHRAFVALGNGSVGVSFPGLNLVEHVSLGERLRLHATEGQLAQLMSLNWLTGMRDHIQTSGVMAVPAHANHRTFFRVQAKSNPARLRRRRMKRKGEDIEAARHAIPDSCAKRLALPYAMLTSQSTGERFPLFVDAGPIVEHAVPGTFSAYGRSRVVTVPWF